MQTFLPSKDFTKCAEILDNVRLNKQRVECKQILNALETGNGWIHHPAVKMWKGYEEHLKYYMNCMIIEWINRGFKNNMSLNEVSQKVTETTPEWIDEKLIYSHQANLQRKDSDHYTWKDIDINAPYWWPTGMKDKKRDKEMREYYENFKI